MKIYGKGEKTNRIQFLIFIGYQTNSEIEQYYYDLKNFGAINTEDFAEIA